MLEGRFGNEEVGEKRRFGDTCGTGWWGEVAEEGRVVRELGREARSSKTRQRGIPRESVRSGRVGKIGFPSSPLHPQEAEVQRLKEEKEALEKKLEVKGPSSEHISRSGQTYYYNAETKQSVWTRPPEDAQDRRATTHRISKWGLELLNRNKNEQGTRSQSELVTASSSTESSIGGCRAEERKPEAPVISGPLPVPSSPLQALASVYPSFSHEVGRIPQEKILTQVYPNPKTQIMPFGFSANNASVEMSRKERGGDGHALRGGGGHKQSERGGGGVQKERAVCASHPPPPQWTPEDELLKELVMKHGCCKWCVIAGGLPGR